MDRIWFDSVSSSVPRTSEFYGQILSKLARSFIVQEFEEPCSGTRFGHVETEYRIRHCHHDQGYRQLFWIALRLSILWRRFLDNIRFRNARNPSTGFRTVLRQIRSAVGYILTGWIQQNRSDPSEWRRFILDAPIKCGSEERPMKWRLYNRIRIRQHCKEKQYFISNKLGSNSSHLSQQDAVRIASLVGVHGCLRQAALTINYM